MYYDVKDFFWNAVSQVPFRAGRQITIQLIDLKLIINKTKLMTNLLIYQRGAWDIRTASGPSYLNNLFNCNYLPKNTRCETARPDRELPFADMCPLFRFSSPLIVVLWAEIKLSPEGVF